MPCTVVQVQNIGLAVLANRIIERTDPIAPHQLGARDRLPIHRHNDRPAFDHLHAADVILGIGCSFSRTNFGTAMPEGITLIQATLDPQDLNKDVPVDHALLGDAALTLDLLLEAVR